MEIQVESKLTKAKNLLLHKITELSQNSTNDDGLTALKKTILDEQIEDCLLWKSRVLEEILALPEKEYAKLQGGLLLFVLTEPTLQTTVLREQTLMEKFRQELEQRLSKYIQVLDYSQKYDYFKKNGSRLGDCNKIMEIAKGQQDLKQVIIGIIEYLYSDNFKTGLRNKSSLRDEIVNLLLMPAYSKFAIFCDTKIEQISTYEKLSGLAYQRLLKLQEVKVEQNNQEDLKVKSLESKIELLSKNLEEKSSQLEKLETMLLKLSQPQKKDENKPNMSPISRSLLSYDELEKNLLEETKLSSVPEKKSKPLFQEDSDITFFSNTNNSQLPTTNLSSPLGNNIHPQKKEEVTYISFEDKGVVQNKVVEETVTVYSTAPVNKVGCIVM